MYNQEIEMTRPEQRTQCMEIAQNLEHNLQKQAAIIKDLSSKLNSLFTIPENPGLPGKEQAPDNSFCATVSRGIEAFARQNDELEKLLQHFSRVI